MNDGVLWKKIGESKCTVPCTACAAEIKIGERHWITKYEECCGYGLVAHEHISCPVPILTEDGEDMSDRHIETPEFSRRNQD